MTRTTLRLAVAGATLTLVATACGGDSGNERVLEELIESESGENVDVDLDGDGGISFESEDGSFTLGEDGNVTFDGADGSGTFSSDGDGGGDITFEGAEGSGSIDIDGDGGFTVTDENGEVVTGDVSTGDGGDLDISVDGEDGEVVFDTDSGIPDEWPDDVPQPSGLTAVTGTYLAEGDQQSVVASGTFGGSATDYLTEYAAELADAGFSEESNYSQDGEFVNVVYQRDDWVVSATITPTGDGTSSVIVAISSL